MSVAEKTKDGAEKRKVSVIVIMEILILAFGVLLSIEGSVQALRVTFKYAWCFVFAVFGVGLIGVLIWRIRKRFTWLIGIVFIIIYLFTAGFGYFVCTLNKARIKRLQYYESKTVCAYVDDVKYSWDGKSVTYNSEDLIYVNGYPEHIIKVYIDDEERSMGVYTDPSSQDIYLEIYGGATGDYLILAKEVIQDPGQ